MARCTVERLMQKLNIQGVRRGKPARTTLPDRCGDSYNNALAETINGLYKTEVIHKDEPWRGNVEIATLSWVDGFNKQRLLEPIGDIPPAEYEMLYYQTGSRHVA